MLLPFTEVSLKMWILNDWSLHLLVVKIQTFWKHAEDSSMPMFKGEKHTRRSWTPAGEKWTVCESRPLSAIAEKNFEDESFKKIQKWEKWIITVLMYFYRF